MDWPVKKLLATSFPFLRPFGPVHNWAKIGTGFIYYVYWQSGFPAVLILCATLYRGNVLIFAAAQRPPFPGNLSFSRCAALRTRFECEINEPRLLSLSPPLSPSLSPSLHPVFVVAAAALRGLSSLSLLLLYIPVVEGEGQSSRSSSRTCGWISGLRLGSKEAGRSSSPSLH